MADRPDPRGWTAPRGGGYQATSTGEPKPPAPAGRGSASAPSPEGRAEGLRVEGTRNVEKALRATDRGEAYHWPTIAGILADEVRRLRAVVSPALAQRDAETRCAWCDSPARGVADHGGGDWHPSCGVPQHGFDFRADPDAALAQRDGLTDVRRWVANTVDPAKSGVQVKADVLHLLDRVAAGQRPVDGGDGNGGTRWTVAASGDGTGKPT